MSGINNTFTGFTETSSRLLFIIIMLILCILFLQVTTIQALVGHLPPNEVNALKEIAKQLGKEDWDFSLNPCDGNNPNWNTPTNQNLPRFDNVVNCSCTPDDACHVVSISLKGQDLGGVLPPSLAKLPSIKMINLAFNYLNGTIPNDWASTKLEFISLTGNRLSGSIPAFLSNITTLESLSLDDNMFSGKVPAELGKLKKLYRLVLTANNLTGDLPMELNSLTNLTELRLDSNYFSGKIPNLGSCTRLKMLSISDLNGEYSLFPNISSLIHMEKLVLRSCNLRGTIPGYLSNMPELRHLDLSFNYLSGDIPNLSGLKLQKMYLTGNNLNGSVPDWLINEDVRNGEVDLSYNNFNEKSVPQNCLETLNLFRSYTSSNYSDLGKCLNRYPCSKAYYYSVHINCGGREVKIGDKIYEADENPIGAARFVPSNNHWGLGNTGSLWNTKDTPNEYLQTKISLLTMNDSQLYTEARHSPLSLTYYARCLANGNYTVTLHFAEIVFRDNRS